MRTIYIDYTFLANYPDLNTGVQRVVRRVIDHVPQVAEELGVRAQVVKLAGGELIPVDLGEGAQEGPHDKRAVNGEYAQGQSASEAVKRDNRSDDLRIWARNRLFLLRRYFQGIKMASFALFAAIFGHRTANQLLRSYRAIRKYLTIGQGAGVGNQSDATLLSGSTQVSYPRKSNAQSAGRGIYADDVLLMLDSSWHMDIWPSLDEFKAQGGKVVFVVYDLIPIVYPQFCDENLVRVFDDWLRKTVKYASGYVCISNAVKNDVRKFLDLYYSDKLANISLDSFNLGADFSARALSNSDIRAELRRALSTMCFLTVSTIEPRKNHEFILRAFEALWTEGVECNLLFIGKRGWKVENLLRRLDQHPRRGLNLFVFHDATDTELAYAYANSRALVFASFAEGYGLPIVESLVNKLPVLASDIPCHREVGGQLVEYFALDDQEGLRALVVKKCEIPKSQDQQVIECYGPTTWLQSTRVLLSKVSSAH